MKTEDANIWSDLEWLLAYKCAYSFLVGVSWLCLSVILNRKIPGPQSDFHGWNLSWIWRRENATSHDNRASVRLVSQSCPIICDPIDCSLPGSSVHGISQARILEWVPVSFSDPGIEPTSLAFPGRFFTTEPPGKLYPASPGPLKGNTRLLLMAGTWRVYAIIGFCSALLETYLPACLQSPESVGEQQFTVWLAAACLHVGNKAGHCAGLATSFPSQSSWCVCYPGSGLNVLFVVDLRVPRWVCLLCGSPGLNKYIKATYTAWHWSQPQ